MWDAGGYTALPKPEPPTCVNAGSSLLPTPRASDGPHGSPRCTGTGLPPVISTLFPTPTQACGTGGQTSRSGTRKNEKLLNGTVQQLFPTPAAGNFNDGESLASQEARRRRNLDRGINGNGQGTPLTIAVQALFPTPAARDSKGISLHGPGTIRSDTGRPRTVLQADLPSAVLALAAGELLLPTPMASVNSKSTRALTTSRKNGRRDGGGQSSPLGLEEIARIAAGHRVPHLPPEEMLPPRSKMIMDSFQAGDYTRPLSGDGN